MDGGYALPGERERERKTEEERERERESKSERLLSRELSTHSLAH